MSFEFKQFMSVVFAVLGVGIFVITITIVIVNKTKENEISFHDFLLKDYIAKRSKYSIPITISYVLVLISVAFRRLL